MSEKLGTGVEVQRQSARSESKHETYQRRLEELKQKLPVETFVAFYKILQEIESIDEKRRVLRYEEKQTTSARMYQMLKGDEHPPAIIYENIHKGYEYSDQQLMPSLRERVRDAYEFMDGKIFDDFRESFGQLQEMDRESLFRQDREIEDLQKELMASLKNREQIDKIRAMLKGLPKGEVANDNNVSNDQAKNVESKWTVEEHSRLLNELEKKLPKEEFTAFDDALFAVEKLHSDRMGLRNQEETELQAMMYRLSKGEGGTPDLTLEYDVNRHTHFVEQDQKLAALMPERLQALNKKMEKGVFDNFRQSFLTMRGLRDGDRVGADERIVVLRKELSSMIVNRKGSGGGALPPLKAAA